MGGSVANSRPWRQRKEYNGFDKLPVENARGRFGKSMDSNIIFLEGWARCRAGRFSNVDEVTSVFHGRHLQIIKPTLRSVGLRAGFLLGEERVGKKRVPRSFVAAKHGPDAC